MALPVKVWFAPVLLIPLAACIDCSLVGEAGGTGAPTATLLLSANAGQAPLELALDAGASTPFQPGEALRFDFDFDGDGTFEIEGSSDALVEHTYPRGGSFTPLVRVRGPDGRYDVDDADLEVAPVNAPRTADVDVDSDHDGRITGADEAVEDDNDAAFFGNVDDDNDDGQRDRDDSVLNDVDDDTFPLVVRKVGGLESARVFIEVTPTLAATRTRLWLNQNILTDASTARAEVNNAGIDDVELRLESLTGRTGDWDGRVTVSVTVEDNGEVISTDTVHLRAAPVIFPDNLQAPQQLFVMDLDDGDDNNRALIAAFQTGLPAGINLYKLNGDTYFYDRWVQDSWELGSQTVPLYTDGRGLAVHEMITAMQTERSYGGEGLEAFVPNEWLSAGRGFYYPAGDETSHNYGGNLETSPPTSQDPFGRMIYGGGTSTLSGASSPDTMNANQVAFLNAQEIQGPALEVSSEWLAVGHVDEIFQFVPDLSPDEGGHAFKVAIASPRLARDVLLSLRSNGQGAAVLFSGRRTPYTVDEVLNAEAFSALNELAQARIDAVQQQLTLTLGLNDDDFRPVPVMFDEVDGSGLVAAFNPGVQNLVTMGTRLFAPDPEGPVVSGTDAWQTATLASLADTDLDVVFVDVFESYHELLGEAHCGTNVERAPYATAWWTVEK